MKSFVFGDGKLCQRADANPKQLKKDAFSKRSGYMWTGRYLPVLPVKLQSCLLAFSAILFQIAVLAGSQEHLMAIKGSALPIGKLFTWLNVVVVVVVDVVVAFRFPIFSALRK